MVFIDEIDIYVSSGKGGDGMFSFSRKKNSSNKFPDGGNGGHGGDVFLIGDKHCFTFYKLKFKSNYKAEDGFPGKSKCKTGKQGKNLFINVPLGSKIFDKDRQIFLGEINYNKQCLRVACGGKAGYGNFALRSNKNISEKIKIGEKFELKYLRLELNLLSNVGLLGFPNTGKSSFINRVSNVLSKIGNYSFTTLKPVLGVLKPKYGNKIVFADIPGLIEHSYKGKGLGSNFLKHMSKTKILLHFIDTYSINTTESFLKEIFIINRELKNFDLDLFLKEKWLIFNKIDLINFIKFEWYFLDFINKFNYTYIFFISSKKNIGLKKLCFNLNKRFS